MKDRYSRIFQSTGPLRDPTDAPGTHRKRHRISIHRSLAGPDRSAAGGGEPDADFNPQVPCGTRRPRQTPASTTANFNPQVPCGTRRQDQVQPRQPGISIHRSLAGPDDHHVIVLIVTIISIHRSLAGPDIRPGQVLPKRWNFNPQVPCGTRPDRVIRHYDVNDFNPQVPCGTRRATRCSRTSSYHFNPQVPCGTRPDLLSEVTVAIRFQSTGPLRDPTFP